MSNPWGNPPSRIGAKNMAKKKDGKPTKPEATKLKTAKLDAESTKTGKGAARRVAQLKGKLTEAMQDPLMRDQIVRAIRAMMQEK